MTHFRKLIPALGFLLWSGLILLFDRHDLGFYLVTFLFSLMFVFLGLAQTGPQYVEVKVDEEKS